MLQKLLIDVIVAAAAVVAEEVVVGDPVFDVDDVALEL